MRTIDADALKARLRGCMILMPNGEKCTAERAIDTQGTIAAEPVRHGRWVYDHNGIVICTVCHYPRQIGAKDVCGKCGAKMDGGADNG